MPNTNIYRGTVYEIGEQIPNYVPVVYTPHVWYDQSKSIDSNTNVFEKLAVSESLLLGKSEDDMWTIEEILEEMLKYLNLHIIQEGYDYYVFDWETAKSDHSVTWIDLLGDNRSITKSYSDILVTESMFAGDDTQLSVADVYNQVSVKDNITELKDVIFSPLDSKTLLDITSPQTYMIEYAAPGCGKDAFNVFYDMVKNNTIPETNYGKNDGEKAYKKKWVMKLKKSQYWDFLLNGISSSTAYDVDANGKIVNQWKLPKYIDETPFASGILSFAAGDEYNKENTQNIENITKFEDYICINVAGNGADEQSNKAQQDYGVIANPPAMFPNENDLKNCGLEIKYLYPVSGRYSSADSSIMNYIVFSGQIMMTPARQVTGPQGFRNIGVSIYTTDYYNNLTLKANDPSKGGNYVDWEVFKRKLNMFNNYATWPNNKSDAALQYASKVVPNSKNDDGAYYGIQFYKNIYPYDPDLLDTNMNNLLPPIDRGNIAKRFMYSIDKYSYLNSSGIDYDIIPYVDILACQLRIGDKYCEEYITTRTINGTQIAYKNFRWVTAQELINRGEGTGYELLPDGSTRYKAYINLAININNGQYLIGQNLDMYNNIDNTMGLDKTGMAISLPADDHLQGELDFSIVGPVNLSWDNGIRRHKTWFRHTQVTPNAISVMPHVDKIWIKKFSIDFVSDRGKNVEAQNADIVYRSDEQKKYINKYDTEFKFTTMLSASEAAQMNVNPGINESDIVDINGNSIMQITDTHTNETDKPEKIYVDAYYREYCSPKTILETTLHDSDNISIFNKYSFSFMNNKTYYVLGEEKDLKNGTTKIKLKEK